MGAIRDGLPIEIGDPPAETPNPAIIRPRTIIPVHFRGDWDETLRKKVKRGTREGIISWNTNTIVDRSPKRSGKGKVRGLMVSFHHQTLNETIVSDLAAINNEPAHPRALADLMLQNPPPALDGQMPLVAPTPWVGPYGHHFAFCAR